MICRFFKFLFASKFRIFFIEIFPFSIIIDDIKSLYRLHNSRNHGTCSNESLIQIQLAERQNIKGTLILEGCHSRDSLALREWCYSVKFVCRGADQESERKWRKVQKQISQIFRLNR